MSKTSKRAKYTLKFKMEAVRLVKGGKIGHSQSVGHPQGKPRQLGQASGYFEYGRRKKLPKPSHPGANKRMSGETLLAHIRAIHD